jgi:hypothetical protein
MNNLQFIQNPQETVSVFVQTYSMILQIHQNYWCESHCSDIHGNIYNYSMIFHKKIQRFLLIQKINLYTTYWILITLNTILTVPLILLKVQKTAEKKSEFSYFFLWHLSLYIYVDQLYPTINLLTPSLPLKPFTSFSLSSNFCNMQIQLWKNFALKLFLRRCHNP